MESMLLNVRRRQKRKKPEFLRQEYYRHKRRLGRKWRQPMGRTSKLRMKEKARGKQPSIGYGSPAAVRGLSRFGYRLVKVANAHEMPEIDPKKEMIEISAGAGGKKKADIIKAAKGKGIMIFNRPKRVPDKEADSGKEKTNDNQDTVFQRNNTD